MRGHSEDRAGETTPHEPLPFPAYLKNHPFDTSEVRSSGALETLDGYV